MLGDLERDLGTEKWEWEEIRGGLELEVEGAGHKH